jgi:cbb3-type cytochrome oxidase maturation protein
MFVPVWLIFLASGTLMAIVTLVWSIRNHQFDDQERARYLPLTDLSAEELASPQRVRRGANYFGLISILTLNALAIGFTLFLAVKYM